ncbi:hypothetical protein FNF31_01640 [Cafeteria roenbergensis]|uniref:Uncharacterized protein n=1 Tax=Cafeteria roenbergensis TaxID=33653 RepID=A0A5A8DN40_CAFRO|nr:hypothetical protein FNF31_01640 [Cafeteria roenbergensis]
MTQPAAQLVDALLGRFVADPSAGGSFLSLLQRVSSLQPAGGAPSKAAEPGAASDCGAAGGAAHPPQRLQIVRRVFRSGWQDVSAMLKPFISGESFLELQEVVVVDRAANVAVSRVRNGNFRWLLEYEARMTLRPSDCAGGAALSFQFSAAPISFMGSLLTRALAGDGGEAPLVDLARQDLIDAMHMASARGGAAGADAVDVEWCADGGRFGELPALADVLPRGFRAV